MRRTGDGRSYLFALNHTEAEAALAVNGRDLVADTDTGGNLRLAPGGVAVVREDR
ncbi:Beta-galactosidase C-terminal domain [Angustibacter sp. Root456]|uniref:Beta-galactosidase C-terminal domain n=1 Tax=Angustibacter sp. Root456 TaxID=1736539 RepID=UPI003519675C